MRLITLFVALVSVFTVSAQQTVKDGSGASDIISQYGTTFKNAGGSILHDKVNGNISYIFAILTIINYIQCTLSFMETGLQHKVSKSKQLLCISLTIFQLVLGLIFVRMLFFF